MPQKKRVVIVVVALAAASLYLFFRMRPTPIVLSGVVTTNEVVVSSQVGGKLGRLLVTEGDSVKKDQVLALIVPDELRADTAYYAHSAQGMSAQVRASAADLRFQEKQTTDQILQAESTLAAGEAQIAAAAADSTQARITFERSRDLSHQGVVSQQDLDQAKASADAAEAKLEALKKQAEAERASLAMARATAEQVKVKRGQLQNNEQMQQAAAAQSAKADVRLGYAELRAPIDGIVDVRAAREGEVVTAGQAVVTLVNPDDLWIRADVEESYIDGVRIGDKRTIRLPSGAEREGTVVFRGVDAGYATQRDVSRTKRDIKTFEVRLRADNADRRLALGMTAYVLLPAR